MDKIVLVVDDPQWAFAISANDMKEYMKEWFDFKIINYYENPANTEHYKDADLVYLFGTYMDAWMPENFNFRKSCAGVRAIFGYLDGEDTTQSPAECKQANSFLTFPHIHVVSKELLEKFKGFHPYVSYVSHGVNTDFYTPHNPKNKVLTIGWAGNRTNPEKNIELLEKVCANRDDVILKTAEFRKNQLNREQMRAFYQSLDVYCLPSRTEGNSATLMEAISCGLPIIATPTGTWLEIEPRTKGGVTINPTYEELNNAIDTMLKADRESMGKANRKSAEKYWDWKIKAEEFKEFFEKSMTKQGKTVETFSHKWTVMTPQYGMTKEQETFFQDWATAKYGFETIDELNAFYRSKNNILEVGVGSGFNLEYISKHTGARMTACDASSVVCANIRKLLGERVLVYNCDLKDVPKKYDLIIADGVLHHTPSTKEAALALYDKLEVGGHMYAYIYRKMGAIREFTNDTIRNKISTMTEDEKVEYCKGITDFAREIDKFKDKIYVDMEILGLKPGFYTPHELIYYGVIKCFWNDAFSYEENNLNNYDWFAPQEAWTHTDEEVLGWFKDLPCECKINNANPNGISLLVKKNG